MHQTLTAVSFLASEQNCVTCLCVPGLCPQEFEFVNGYCYHLSDESATWQTGRSRCQALGGFLAVIDTVTEMKTTFDYVEKKGNVRHYYTAQTDLYNIKKV